MEEGRNEMERGGNGMENGGYPGSQLKVRDCASEGRPADLLN